MQEASVQVQSEIPTAEIATQYDKQIYLSQLDVNGIFRSTPPPSPKPKTPPPPKPKEASFITDTASDTSVDISDGEMMKEISDGEMVQQSKYLGENNPAGSSLASSARSRFGLRTSIGVGSGRFGGFGMGASARNRTPLPYHSNVDLNEDQNEDNEDHFSEGSAY